MASVYFIRNFIFIFSVKHFVCVSEDSQLNYIVDPLWPSDLKCWLTDLIASVYFIRNYIFIYSCFLFFIFMSEDSHLNYIMRHQWPSDIKCWLTDYSTSECLASK